MRAGSLLVVRAKVFRVGHGTSRLDAVDVCVTHLGGQVRVLAVTFENPSAFGHAGKVEVRTLNSVDAFAPWLEYAIEAFTVDRCMFASNFPVDATCGTFDELYEIFNSVTSGLDSESRAKLFAENAERVYRC